ncbi:hypothetical protein OPS25_15665 [Alteromonas ponticola]|uniref:Phosphate-selective porin O and P n=1 Tax=Alteromonas aquimaris TaxID=2998417 RepID=A0ABT3PAY4_9ALTE|nr:hypothetical protein [Alteromonas aquimaris]MCW8109943.1 hypothetical protein [Alteromonas aquimaris]
MKKLIIFALMVLFASVAAAQQTSWHGYVSQGVTQSSGSHFVTDNEAITTELTELGINGRYQFNSSLALVGQFVYLDGGNRYEQGSRLDYLFLDWAVLENDVMSSHLHVGRYKNHHWLYSATRDVPHTRETAILPQSVYFDSFRDIALGSDGVFLQSEYRSGVGQWQFNWSLGRSDVSEEQTKAFLGPLANGSSKQDYVHQVSLYWQPDSLNWRLGVSYLASDFYYEAAPVDSFIDGSTQIERLVLSLQYFSEKWELSAELLQERRENRGGISPTFRQERAGEGGYVQGRYLLSSSLSSLLRLDFYDVDKNDPDGHKLNHATGGRVPAYFGYMDTTAVGLRWDITSNWRLQGEHHWVEGGGRIQGVVDPSTINSTEKYWRMWSIQLMHWF